MTYSFYKDASHRRNRLMPWHIQGGSRLARSGAGRPRWPDRNRGV